MYGGRYFLMRKLVLEVSVCNTPKHKNQVPGLFLPVVFKKARIRNRAHRAEMFQRATHAEGFI